MANKFASGFYRPTHPEKYLGKTLPTYRSSWELTLMRVFDSHPSVVGWASEPIQIPYQDPSSGRWRAYIPDFLLVYIDAKGVKHGEVIEVKPARQTLESAAKTKRDRAAIAINTAKWQAAQAWCSNSGLRFRVMTEAEIFRNAR